MISFGFILHGGSRNRLAATSREEDENVLSRSEDEPPSQFDINITRLILLHYVRVGRLIKFNFPWFC